MIIVKKILSVVISFSLFVTLLPINLLSASITPNFYNFNSFGKITSANFYDTDTIVINIQDLHNNKEVQENTYKFLTSLNNRYKNIEVYIEGASKNVEFSNFIKSVGKDNANEFIEALYEKANITGAEYFGYKNNKTLNPIEQKDIYENGINQIATLIHNKSTIEQLLRFKYLNVKKLSNKYLTGNQKKVLRLYNKYIDKKITSAEFYKKITAELEKANINPSKYVNSTLYKTILAESIKTDQNKVKKQLQHLLSTLKGTIPFQEYSNLIKESDNFFNIDVVFSYINAKISPEDKYKKYPDLFRLIKLKEMASLIEPLDLVHEEKEMVSDVLLSYSKYSANKDIVFLNMFLPIYRNLLMANISFNEYEYYKNNIRLFYKLYSKYIQNDDFFELYKYSTTAESFNNLNIERNNLFAKTLLEDNKNVSTKSNKIFGRYANINAILNSLPKAKKIKVIVAGGFHTSGVNYLLDNNKVSYITITPNIKSEDDQYEQHYLDSILIQAEVDKNAIAGEPLLEQKAPLFSSNLASVLKNYRNAGYSWEKISTYINNIIKANNFQDSIEFVVSDNGAMFKVDSDGGKYQIEYNNGEISINKYNNNNNSKQSTALGKNIKLLIKEALNLSSVSRMLGISVRDEIEKISNNENVNENQAAADLLRKHNILLPEFADKFFASLFRVSAKVKSNERLKKLLADVLRDSGQEEFKDAKIVVGTSPKLVGAKADGYGGTQDYGCLVYVSREMDGKGIYHAKEFFIADVLIQKLEGRNDDEILGFFEALLNHERLESIALQGESDIFNSYIKINNKSKNTGTFHEFVNSTNFNDFLKEQGYSQEHYAVQVELLDILDKIIQEINDSNSEYSNVISVSELAEKKDYSSDKIRDFLNVRIGVQEVTRQYINELADKIIKQIEKEQRIQINKNSDIKKVSEVLDEYVIAYRQSDGERYMRDIADSVKSRLENLIIHRMELDQTSENAKNIKIKITIIRENLENTGYEDKFFLDDPKTVQNRNILFVDDIMSKQSDTFNRIYDLLMKLKSNKVQGCVFFDLSKESEQNLLSNMVYELILKPQDDDNKSSILDNIINDLNGNVSKYIVPWLIRLVSENKDVFEKIIDGLNDSSKKQLIKSIYTILEQKQNIKNVSSYEVFYLLMCLSNKEILNDDNKDKILEVYKKSDLENLVKEKKDGKGLLMEAKYDNWRDNVPFLILYASLQGYSIIDLSGISTLNFQERKSISKYANKYNITIVDKKTKSKHEYASKLNEQGLNEAITVLKSKVDGYRSIFNETVKKINSNQKYFDETALDKANKEYSTNIRLAMQEAKILALNILKKDGIPIDERLFLIIVGGSLVKGNMMVDSDIYYDIIVPDGFTARSIEAYFTPLYFSILQKMGLNNYHVLKYSTTRISRRNINTFVDEKDVAVFLDYEPIDGNTNDPLYRKYMDKVIEEAVSRGKETSEDLAVVTRQYYPISKEGHGELGNSFIQSHTGNESFSNRWTLMAFESKLKEMIFKYIYDNRDEKEIDMTKIPRSVEEQINFIKKNIVRSAAENQQIDQLYKAWMLLSGYRYVKTNNTWTDSTEEEKQQRELINEFVKPEASKTNFRPIQKIGKKAANYGDVLSIIEKFFYDNVSSVDVYRKGYDSYSHISKWMTHNLKADKEQSHEIWNKAKIISLLLEIDNDEIRNKLKNISYINSYTDDIFESLDNIKKIDSDFPGYSKLDGERSLQNYWNAIITTAKTPDTMLALLAYKLTKAQYSENQDDKKLIYTVYLPLSKRFGQSEIYEYIRNTLFEFDYPKEYLNLLSIIKSLYGKTYSEINNINETIYKQFGRYLRAENVTIKFRTKSLYSIYEKINSKRVHEEEIKPVTQTEKDFITFILKDRKTFLENDRELKEYSDMLVDMIKSVYYEKFSYTDNYEKMKEDIISVLNKRFSSQSDKEKEFCHALVKNLKLQIFQNPQFVEFISLMIEKAENEKSKDDNNKNQTLRDYLLSSQESLKNKYSVCIWLFDLFGESLKDLVGLHIIAEDDKYQKVEEMLGKYKNKTIFSDLKVNSNNMQSRLKMNGLIKGERLLIPSEICLYKETDYNNETYGLYNSGKISASHYIYKMGAGWEANYMENIFAHTVDLNYMYSPSEDAQESKRFIFTSDNFVPTYDVSDNFEKIASQFDNVVTCFVEYNDKVYIQVLPKGSTVYDLGMFKEFSDKGEVAVYDEYGDSLEADAKVENIKRYKIFKDNIGMKIPQEQEDFHTTRSKLQYERRNSSKNQTDDISTLNELRKKMKSSDIIKLSSILLNNTELIDMKELTVKEIAAQIMVKENIDQKNKQKFQDNLEIFITMLRHFLKTYGLDKINISHFLIKSIDIANHYKLANVVELYESVAYGIIQLDSIKAYFYTFVNIETNDFTGIIDKISKVMRIKELSDISQYSRNKIVFNIKDADGKVINVKTYTLESSLIDSEIIKRLFSIEGIKNISSRKNKNETGTFVSLESVRAKDALPLMSLGNNIEELVRYAAQFHSQLIPEILLGTELMSKQAINNENLNEETLTSLLNEYPVLLTQILLSLYEQSEYDEGELLSKETPLLTQAEVNNMKTEIQDKLNISNVNIKISQNLDLVLDDDTYSFATLNVQNNEVTLYISEMFLKALESIPDKRSQMLSELIFHETSEYIALSSEKVSDYKKFHEQIKDNINQQELLDFVSGIAKQIALTKKQNALFEMAYFLSQSEDFKEKLDALIICGNDDFSTFRKAFDLYKNGKAKKLIITGGHGRLTMPLIENLREKHQERSGKLKRTINNVDDLISLSESEFKKLQDMDDLQRKQIIQVSEADIIKYIILDMAKQEKVEISENDIILETQSTNTPENFRNVLKLKAFNDILSNTDKSVRIGFIQTPLSQFRAFSTMNKEFGNLISSDKIIPYSISVNNIYQNKDAENVLKNSVSEIARLIAYTLSGDINPILNSKQGLTAIPVEIFKSMLISISDMTNEDKITIYKLFESIKNRGNANFESKETVMTALNKLVQNDSEANKYQYILSQIIEQIYSIQDIQQTKNVLEEIPVIELDKNITDTKISLERTRNILSAA